MEKVILSSDENNKNIEINIEDAYELDYIKSMIRDGIIQVKMPIKVKCDYNDLEILKKFLTLRRDNNKEELDNFRSNLFSLESKETSGRLFSFTKCAHYLRAYNILDEITSYFAKEINNCENKEEICKKFDIPEILIEDN